MNTDKVFNAIKSFITEINNLYGMRYKPLALYGRLIEKTDVTHEIPVKKHINAFRKFVITNRTAICNKDESQFKTQKIKYNDNVYFNVVNVINMADSDTKSVIWQHLLVLSALLDNQSNAKQILKEQMLVKSEPEPTNTGTDQMLSSIMNMFTSSMMPSGNDDSSLNTDGIGNLLGGLAGGSGGGDISTVFNQIMTSGIIPKMMDTINTNMSDGKLDLGNVIQSVQKLAKECNINLPESDLNNGDIDGVLGMFSGLGLDKDKMKDVVDSLKVQSSESDVAEELSNIQVCSTEVVEDDDDNKPADKNEYECKDGVCYITN